MIPSGRCKSVGKNPGKKICPWRGQEFGHSLNKSEGIAKTKEHPPPAPPHLLEVYDWLFCLSAEEEKNHHAVKLILAGYCKNLCKESSSTPGHCSCPSPAPCPPFEAEYLYLVDSDAVH